MISARMIVTTALMSLASAHAGDLPTVGRSLFDQVFYRVQGGAARIDWPKDFEGFRSRIGQACHTPDTGQIAVLIPLGRSRQKPEAGGADPFLYPRGVFTVTTRASVPFEYPGSPSSPVPGAALDAGSLDLRDRLFFAYHEPRQQIEVISFNEDDGRWEFQVIEDFPKAPKLRYARRAECVTCHQDQSPLFNVASWAETNSAATTESLLELAHGAHARYLGTSVTAPPHQPLTLALGGNFETSVKRGTELARLDRHFIDGCARVSAAQGGPEACRADFLRYFLVQKLLHGMTASSDEQPVDAGSALRGWVAPEWAQYVKSSQQYDPILADRDPIAPVARSLGLGESYRLQDVLVKVPLKQLGARAIAQPLPEALDPRTPRPVAAPDLGNPFASQSFAGELAGFFSDEQIARLAESLVLPTASAGTGTASAAAAKRARGLVLVGQWNEAKQRGAVNLKDGAQGYYSGRLTGACASGVCRLTMKPGQPGDALTASFEVRVIPWTTWRSGAPDAPAAGALSSVTLRYAGQAAVTVNLQCVETPGAVGGLGFRCSAYDLRELSRRLGVLAMRAREQKSDLLAAKGIRAPLITAALSSSAVNEPDTSAHSAEMKLIPAVLQERPAGDISAFPGVQYRSLSRFYQYCARCHRGDAAVTPAFLNGITERAVLKSVAAMAPRIRQRLVMVDAAGQLTMPPAGSPESTALASHAEDRAALTGIWLDEVTSLAK